MSRRLDEQTCRFCGVVVGDLNRHAYHARKRIRRCKACHKRITDEWKASHKDLLAERARVRNKKKRLAYSPSQKRDYHLRKNYGMTLTEYLELFRKQGECCANQGCRTTQPKSGWHLDHDHGSGAIRGILCSECNRLLGCGNDSVTVIRGAAEYLERSRDVQKAG